MSALTLGLTGGIASGKSLVEGLLRDRGVPVLDADQVSRDVVKPGEPALASIAATFGPDMLQADGSLDRRRMREHVFANPEARRQLEALLHPLIGARLRQWRDAQTAPYCVLSVAILLESPMRHLIDRIVVVDIPEALQVARLVARDGIDATLAGQMLAAQAKRETRLAAADDVIDNSGSRDDTARQIDALHPHWLAIAQQRAAAV